MKFRISIKKILFLIVAFTVVMRAVPVKAEPLFTKEEQEYINSRATIKAVSVDGVAPIQYYDKNGDVKGISINVLNYICDITGLNFEYELYDHIDEAKNSDADIIFGVIQKNQLKNVPLSIPYLESESIMYINSSVSLNDLENKKYAAIKGTILPDGIKEENTIYFNTREDCIDAVNSRKADYGYANAYSLAFYTMQNSYQNIITVPDEIEPRAYCMAFLNNDERLISIINKGISSIDKNYMNSLVLSAATEVDRKISISMVLHAYGIQIFVAIFLIMTILLISIVQNVKDKNEIKMQYERYQMVSKTLNEYLYEYNVKTKELELSKSCIELFGDVDNLKELKVAINKAVINHDNIIPIIELPIANGEKRPFKSASSFLCNDKGKIYSMIGKLVDVNEEEEEKRRLIQKSERDGLTGIYNAITARKLITERIKSVNSNEKDALIVIDCDKFKGINDTYGHLNGDKVLINISKCMTETFRETDIMGRIGGDEFCVYMSNISSEDMVVSKCQEYMDLIGELNKGLNTTVSIGISFLTNEKSYEDLFQKADKALYDVK